MIGIFDSGVGGMTVARAVERMLPDHRLIYFGDLARTPYGSKSPETIISYARQNTEFLLAKGARLIVIACNSAASVASDDLPTRFNVPFFEVITPAVTKAVASTVSGRIGVIGTRATVASGVYVKKIKAVNPDFQVFSQACPLLVPLVEEGWMHKQETKMILRRYLEPLKQKCIDTLVLGCTHYPLLIDLIQHRIGKRIKVIDSAEVLAADLKNYLEQNPEIDNQLERGGDNLFFASDITEAAKSIAKNIFGREIRLDRAAWE
ncbi:MAG: glutamate racemase [Deltaproteobacteria bacterium RIFOXYD12_FULL_50_9]|nr:MAG: glutamate racemase [Deltaproteobacteria bacterium RIFOXYD12_FULL_50_9]